MVSDQTARSAEVILIYFVSNRTGINIYVKYVPGNMHTVSSCFLSYANVLVA